MGHDNTYQKHHAHKGRGTHRLINEIKMFIEKEELVDYVNQLESIENVDIFKIDEKLYKVHVKRIGNHGHCCQDEHNNDSE